MRFYECSCNAFLFSESSVMDVIESQKSTVVMLHVTWPVMKVLLILYIPVALKHNHSLMLPWVGIVQTLFIFPT